MAISRRQFLKRAGLVTAGGVFGPSIFNNQLIQNAFAQSIGDRYFIVLLLDGGNDGANTITSAENPGGNYLRDAYNGVRNTGNGGINLSPTDLQNNHIGLDPNTGEQLAMHPGMSGFPGENIPGGLQQLYSEGKVAVVQGCGYPEYNLSHAASTSIWESANPLGSASYSGSGWVGRAMVEDGYGPADIPAVVVQNSISGDFATSGTSVLAVRRLRNFKFPLDNYGNNAEDAAKKDVFSDLYSAVAGGTQPSLQFIGATGQATLLASDAYQSLDNLYKNDRPTWDQEYSNVGFSTHSDLKEIAKVIYGQECAGGSCPIAGVNSRFFWLRNGGYDTHSDQGGAETTGRHFELFAEVASAIKIFMADMEDMGAADKVSIMIWSEFSRRVNQNENGTDHGSQGPMFVIGNKVNGGVYGNHPDIGDLDNSGNTKYSQNPGNGFRSTDFRDVYGSILKQWINMDMENPAVRQVVLPHDSEIQGGLDPNKYWTTHDFDLVQTANGQPLFLP